MLDAADIAGLSAFYTSLAGWTQKYADDEWVTLTTPDGWRIGLQSAPDHVPPRWLDPAHPQQFHLDIMVDDIEAGEKAALAIGATRLPGDGETGGSMPTQSTSRSVCCGRSTR